MGGHSDMPASAVLDDDIRSYLLSTVTSSVPLDICISKVKGAGSGVYALESLPAGVEAFRVNKPFVTGSHNDGSVCDNCFASVGSNINPAGEYSNDELKLLACQRCHSVKYCSKRCQISAWSSHHKSECKELARLRKTQDKTDPGSERARPTTQALYTAFCRIMRKYICNDLVPGERGAIANLLTHRSEYERRENSTILDDLLQCPAVQPSFKGNLGMSDDEKIDIYCKLMTNSMSIRQPDSEHSLGITLDLFSSMMNHSCDPNVYFFAEGSQLRFRTSRPVTAGEELMISYTDPTYDVSSRTQELSAGYFFKCSCRRCETEQAELETVGADELAVKKTLQIQEKILSSQRQLTYGELTPNAMDAHIREIINGYTPAGHDAKKGWPDSFQPLPDTSVFVARLTQQTDPAYSLKTLLKLCFVTFPAIYGGRSGIHWIEAFSLLVFTVRVFVKNVDRHGEAYDWSLVYMVYLKAMVTDAEKCYGADTAFVNANKRLLMSEKQSLPPEIARSEALVWQFREDQRQMLAWAGVPGAKGVELIYTGRDVF